MLHGLSNILPLIGVMAICPLRIVAVRVKDDLHVRTYVTQVHLDNTLRIQAQVAMVPHTPVLLNSLMTISCNSTELVLYICCFYRG